MPPHVRPEAPTHSRREALRLGAVALGAALLASCGGADEDDPPDAGATPTPTAAPSLLAPIQAPPDGEAGMLRQGLVGEPQPPAELSYARLVAVDPRSAEIHGDLALRVEQAGPLELVIQLRSDAFFHPAPGDGLTAPVDAAAVARDFEMRADAGEFLFNDVIATVEASGPDTLRLRLRGPFALLFEFLGDTDAAAIRAQTPSRLGLPLGAGPFIPERRGDGGISLLPHPLYHQRGLPLLDELRIVSADREAALDAAFESGALDIRTLRSSQSLARAEQRADARTLTRSTRRMRGLGLSLVGAKGGASVRFVEAFQDERVRRALFLSLDHAELAALEDAPSAYPVGPIGPSFVADALPPDELASHALFSHDPGEARKLLDAAGAAGLSFAFEAPNRPPFTELARVLVRQLTEGGLRPALAVVPADDWQLDLARGDFESILFELEPVRTPDVGLRIHTSGGLDGAFSPWGYSNPVFDEATREALRAIDPAERAELAREAQRTLLGDVPALVSLPEPVEQIAVADRVGGYAYDTHEFNEEWLAARWHLRHGAAAQPRTGEVAS